MIYLGYKRKSSLHVIEQQGKQNLQEEGRSELREGEGKIQEINDEGEIFYPISGDPEGIVERISRKG